MLQVCLQGNFKSKLCVKSYYFWAGVSIGEFPPIQTRHLTAPLVWFGVFSAQCTTLSVFLAVCLYTRKCAELAYSVINNSKLIDILLLGAGYCTASRIMIICRRRERHAKTIDIAQEEVLTCLGIHLYERLHRIWQKLRAEEQTWQILFYLCIDALRKNFEVQRTGFLISV